jgi:hypothetical protein
MKSTSLKGNDMQLHLKIRLFGTCCVLLCGLILLFACTTSSQTNGIGGSAAVITPVSTNVTEIGSAPLATFTAEATAGAITRAVTATPTLILPTTPTPGPLTPLPTIALTDEQRKENVAELLRSNGGCNLPCWWGIVPGTSSVQGVAADLTNKGFLASTSFAGIYVGHNIYMDFEVQSDTIAALTITSSLTEGDNRIVYTENWRKYEPSEFVRRHGTPEDVYVYHPFQFDSGGGPAFHILISYKDQGFVIEYWGAAEHLGENRYRACPILANIGAIRLHLFQPGTRADIISQILPVDSVGHIAGPGTVYDIISWEQATGTNLDAFHKMFSAEDSEVCFDFDSK